MGRRRVERDLDQKVVIAYLKHGLCAKDIGYRTGVSGQSVLNYVRRTLPEHYRIMLYCNGMQARRERGGPKSGAGTSGKRV